MGTWGLLFQFILLWESASVQNPQVQILASTTSANHQLPLTIVIDRDSSWKLETVLPYIRKAEEIFAQCDLSLNPIVVVELSHPALESFSPRTDYLVTQDFPNTARPLAVFTDGLFGYVYANADYANSIWGKTEEQGLLARHTVFIDELGAAYVGNAAKTVEAYKGVLAHELMHTLLNVGHNQIPGNILNEVVAQRSFTINAEQCAGLRLSANLL